MAIRSFIDPLHSLLVPKRKSNQKKFSQFFFRCKIFYAYWKFLRILFRNGWRRGESQRFRGWWRRWRKQVLWQEEERHRSGGQDQKEAWGIVRLIDWLIDLLYSKLLECEKGSCHRMSLFAVRRWSSSVEWLKWRTRNWQRRLRARKRKSWPSWPCRRSAAICTSKSCTARSSNRKKFENSPTNGRLSNRVRVRRRNCEQQWTRFLFYLCFSSHVSNLKRIHCRG